MPPLTLLLLLLPDALDPPLLPLQLLSQRGSTPVAIWKLPLLLSVLRRKPRLVLLLHVGRTECTRMLDTRAASYTTYSTPPSKKVRATLS